MSKTIIVIKDKNTIQETVYLDIRELDFGYSDHKVVEIIVTDKSGSTHHFPKENYDLEVYEQIPNYKVKRLPTEDEEYADYAERLIKSNSERVVGPRERAFLEGKTNKIDWFDEIHAQKELNKG